MSSKHAKRVYVTVSNYQKFLVNEIGVQIESDEKFEKGDPQFILDCYYKTCIKLGIAQKTSIAKKIQTKTGEKLEKFDPTHLMKFFIV